MDLFPAFDLIRQPDTGPATEVSTASVKESCPLVVYDGEWQFLERVLNAAGYTDPAAELHLLEWTEDNGPLDLSALALKLGTDRILLFGQDLTALGLHFRIARYAPVTIGGRTYLVADSAVRIAAAKSAGDSGPSRLLWNSMKAAFLKE